MVIAPRIEHGTQALYKCKDGFQLVGSNVTKCMYGTWTSSIPDCQESKPQFYKKKKKLIKLEIKSCRIS